MIDIIFEKNLALPSQMGRRFWSATMSLQALHTIMMNALLRAALKIYVMQVWTATRKYKAFLDLMENSHSNVQITRRDVSTRAPIVNILALILVKSLTSARNVSRDLLKKDISNHI